MITDRHQKLLDGPVGAETGAIAEAFEVTPDRKTVTYTIRKGVKFSDGTPITSEDVRFTFENLIYPKDIATSTRDTLYCAGGKDLPTIKVIDERKISFTCDKPAAQVPFPTTGFVEILSKKNILKLVPNVEKSPKDFNNALGVNTKPEDIVGAGPFKLSKLDPNAVAEFVRNPFYLPRGRERQPASLSRRSTHSSSTHAGAGAGVAAVPQRPDGLPQPAPRRHRHPAVGQGRGAAPHQ
jgi:peptide/nickel transport system substrate-binding protein